MVSREKFVEIILEHDLGNGLNLLQIGSRQENISA